MAIGSHVIANFWHTIDAICTTNRAVTLEYQKTPWQWGLLALVVFGRLLTHAFFGKLQPKEIHRLKSVSSNTISEFVVLFCASSMTFTPSDKQEASPSVFKFGAVLSMFLFTKCFHSLTQGRAEAGFGDSREKMKITAFILVLYAVDIIWLCFCLNRLFNYGRRSAMLFVFTFDMGVLLIDLISTSASVLFPRSTAFGFGVAAGICKLVMYVLFSFLLLANYCIPLHIIPGAYQSLRLSISSTRQYLRFQRVSDKYPRKSFHTAAPKVGDSCVICTDEMVAEDAIELNKCKHTLHYDCMLEWLQRVNSCPICRTLI